MTYYHHENSGKVFSDLIQAREYAIEYVNKAWTQGRSTRPIHYESISEWVPVKGGVKSKWVGTVIVIESGKYIWRPTNKKNSMFLYISGKAARKLTTSEKARYLD